MKKTEGIVQTGLSKEELIKRYMDSIMALESQKKGIAEDIKNEYANAQVDGLDKKALKAAIKAARRTEAEIVEEENQREVYLRAYKGISEASL